jgi:hypothetical protein
MDSSEVVMDSSSTRRDRFGGRRFGRSLKNLQVSTKSGFLSGNELFDSGDLFIQNDSTLPGHDPTKVGW